MIKFFMFFTFCMFFISCSNNENNTDPTSSENSESVALDKDEIPDTRSDVKEEPVAQYSEKTDDPLNDWYFSVRIYETPVTFHYLLKLQFEEIRGEDTLKLPNFGIMPEPVIQKGADKYSCIIGFNDKDGNFREYKKVHVKGNSLKITALKHYAVSSRSKVVE